MNTNTADTERQQRTLDTHRQLTHRGCVVCDPSNPYTLNLQCVPDGNGRVSGSIVSQPWMTGFRGQMHGGMICALLDGAMTQCLMAHDIQAMTAVMHTRFRRAAPLGEELTVVAWIEKHEQGRHRLQSQVRSGENVIAEAEGLFVETGTDL